MAAVNLDIDLQYLTKHYQALKGSGSIQASSLKELMEDEAIQELTKNNIFHDVNDIIKIFKLTKPRNRYAILKLLSNEDLYRLTQHLETKELVLGLKFYHKEALLKFVKQLPKEKMIKMLQSIYTNKETFSLMPERIMNKFLMHDKIEKKEILKVMKEFNSNELMEIIAKATGKRPKTNDKQMLLKQLEVMKPELLKKGLTGLDKKDKIKLMTKLVENNPDYMQFFEEKDLLIPFERSTKQEILKSMEALEVEDLTKMVNQLPREMLTMVLTQIDPDVFAEQLMKYNLDILNELV